MILNLAGNLLSITNEDIKKVIIEGGVTAIGDKVFEDCKNLESVTMSDQVTEIDSAVFSNCNSLGSISINNEYFTTVDGVLFNKNKTELIAYPRAKSDKIYAIPEGTEKILSESLYLKNVADLYIPSSLKTIQYDGVGLGNVNNIYYEGSEEDYGNINIVVYDDIGGGAISDNEQLRYPNQYTWRFVLKYNTPAPKPPAIIGEPEVSAENGEYNFSIALSDVDYESVLITVLYKDRTLAGIKLTTISPENIPQTVTVSAQNADTAKVFIWNDFDNIRSLCDAKEISID